ncbi:MAG: PilZ domain-containing protein [Polyangia bacterium]|jgi:CheY-like chemotaxis protein|nr:PilZ domain-containing protein [Polyangia bacterium]
MSDSPATTKSIIVADHRGPERTVLEAILKRLGYAVHTVETADSLDELLSAGQSADLVILDSNLAGDRADDVARSISRPDRRVVLVDSRHRVGREMIGFIDLTENSFRGIGVRVPEIVFLVNDLLYSRSGVPRRKRRVYGGYPATYELQGEVIQGAIYNLSSEGAFIETVSPPDMKSEVKLRFALPGVGDFTILARVTWRVKADETEGRRSPPGMGVQFTDTPPGDEEKIRTFVAAGGHV